MMNDSGHTVNTVTDDKWTAPLLVNGTILTFKIDTGAEDNLFSEKNLNALTEKPKTFTEKVTPLKAYNNQPIQTKGGCRLKVMAKANCTTCYSPFTNGHKSLLGDKASEDLGLVKRIYQINTDNIKKVKQDKRQEHQQCEGSADIVDKFPSVFKGHRSIQLKGDAKPVVHAPRRVPAPLRAGLKKELERMTQMGVTE